jgi:HAD superfamily hydrolase (TIGR01509 family)
MTYKVAKEIEGLIFDFDGTIVDSMPAHCLSWKEAFSSFGAPLSERFIYDHAGASFIGVVEAYNREMGTDLPPDEVVRLKIKSHVAHLSIVRTIPQVMQVIEQYHGILPMAVATGNSKSMTAPLMDRLKLTRYFAAVIYSEDVEKSKPDPECFLKAARAIHVAPEKCEVFEDGDLGIEAAKRSGMKATDIRPWLHGKQD